MVTAKLYDSDCSMMKCACGNPASCAIIGADCYVSKCNECLYPEEDKVGNLVSEWGTSSRVQFTTSGEK